MRSLLKELIRYAVILINIVLRAYSRGQKEDEDSFLIRVYSGFGCVLRRRRRCDFYISRCKYIPIPKDGALPVRYPQSNYPARCTGIKR